MPLLSLSTWNSFSVFIFHTFHFFEKKLIFFKKIIFQGIYFAECLLIKFCLRFPIFGKNTMEMMLGPQCHVSRSTRYLSIPDNAVFGHWFIRCPPCFSLCKVNIFHFVINKYLPEKYFEILISWFVIKLSPTSFIIH